MALPKHYDPTQTEEQWYAHWEERGYFHSEPDDRPSYSIVIPPPNVTGVLHMGHMLNNTIQDVLARRARMKGYNVCWVPGTDHASIATEAKVVKWLREEKDLTKGDLSREEFIDYAWKWNEKYGGIILEQLRKLGASCDWDRTAFTMDDIRSRSVKRIFVDLYKKDKLYRDLRMVHWDPKAKTVLSNEEVIYNSEHGKLYHVKYPLKDSDDHLVIATTRPETILGDSGIAVHPEDERYEHLENARVIVPLVNREVPVIEDDYVDREFGTGALKITPAHDPNDYDIGKRHDLEVINIFNPDATLNENAKVFVGEDRFSARKKVVEALDKEGLLLEIEDYQHSVGRSERTDAVVEPRLSLQWYVKMKELAEPALEAVMEDEIEFFPKSQKNLYKHWMENIRDWCISRQLWWGHRIPAWYYGDKTFVAETPEEALALVRERHGDDSITLEDLQQDEDVLDTWFSSWLWPISVFNGFEDEEVLDYYYPTKVLVTAWDIIFLWVARMIMAGYEWKGEKPFDDVYFTGMVRDSQRRKMSKSLGNSPDALRLIEEYGADGVRFGMLSCSPAGGDLLFEEKLCEQGRNFCNKIWNALRLVQQWERSNEEPSDLNRLSVRWMHNRIDQCRKTLDDLYSKYKLSEALMQLYQCIWNDFCSWHLELIKPDKGNAVDGETIDATVDMFEELIQLLHPFMPFVTEEIWHHLRNRDQGEDLMISQLDEPKEPEETILEDMKVLRKLVTRIRDIRNEKGIKQQDALELAVENAEQADTFEEKESYQAVLGKMGNISALSVVDEEPSGMHVSFVSGTSKYYLLIPFEAIDIEEERERLQNELEYAKGFVESVEKKLENEGFVNNAPAQVVEREKKKLKDGLERVRILEESLEQLAD